MLRVQCLVCVTERDRGLEESGNGHAQKSEVSFVLVLQCVCVAVRDMRIDVLQCAMLQCACSSRCVAVCSIRTGRLCKKDF